MTMIQGRSLRRPLYAALLLSTAFFAGSIAARELMIVGNDEKVSWDDAGKGVNGAPARTRCWSSTSAPTGWRRGSSPTCR